jgi:hypothetical protein
VSCGRTLFPSLGCIEGAAPTAANRCDAVAVGSYGAFLGTRDDLANVMGWILPRSAPPQIYGTLEIVDARRSDCIAFESRESALLVLLEPRGPQNEEEHGDLLVRVRLAWTEAWRRWPDRAVSVDVAVAGILPQRTEVLLRARRSGIYDRNWIVYNVSGRGMESMIRPLFDEADDGQPGPAYGAMMRQQSAATTPEPEPTENTAQVHYGQIYLLDGENDLPTFDLLGTSPVGLVGVNLGAALMVTGLHTGTVGFKVSVDDHDPPPDLDEYDDVVEVSFESRDGTASLVGWGGEYSRDLPPLPAGPGTYRLRYHTRGMDAAAAAEHSDGPIDEYLLQIWPAPPSPAITLKRTSQQAAYWQNRR